MNMTEFSLKSIADNITKDGAAGIYANSTEAERIEIMLAYFDSFAKKMLHIETVYSTTPEAKREILNVVYENIKLHG